MLTAICYLPRYIWGPVHPHISTKSQDDTRHYCISLAIKGNNRPWGYCNNDIWNIKALGKFVKVFCRCTYQSVEAPCGERVLSLCLLLPKQNEHEKNKLETPLSLSSPLNCWSISLHEEVVWWPNKIIKFCSAILSVLPWNYNFALFKFSPNRRNSGPQDGHCVDFSVHKQLETLLIPFTELIIASVNCTVLKMSRLEFMSVSMQNGEDSLSFIRTLGKLWFSSTNPVLSLISSFLELDW